MDFTRQKNCSLWQKQSETQFSSLLQDQQTEVCIIGAGISGLTAAYLLLKESYRVIVLDKESFAFNETGLSSAHLSNALDDGYLELERLHGPEGSRLACESHTAAMNTVERIIKNENLDCDFMRVEGYLFCGPEQGVEDLKNEFAAASRAGMKSVGFLQDVPLDLNLGPCLRFKNQAQLDPVKYLRGLADSVTRMGGKIFSNTFVTRVVGGKDACVTTNQGHHVHCDQVVVATNVPINDIVTIHTKEYAYRSYVVGLRVPRGQFPLALFWDTSDPYHYVRVHRDLKQSYDVLLVGGEDHKTGQENESADCFLKLIEWAEKKFGVEPQVEVMWSGQIIEPVDGLAYIGLNPGAESNVYVAAGDSGHGLTHGTIAGMLLTDLIAGRANPWQHLYSPSRLSVKVFGTYISENLNSAWQYRDWATSGELSSAESLQPGEGAVLREGLSKVATYRSVEGELHRFSAVCPHLGGIVHWNAAEQTWDCPCHGSRFSRLGEVINGPACQNLTPHGEMREQRYLPASSTDPLVRLGSDSGHL